MIVLDSEDMDGAEVFVNREYIGAVDKDTYILEKILIALGTEAIIEKINLDSYLNEKERNDFYLYDNFHFTEEEEDAILEGQVDYAFDKIKDRIFNKKMRNVLYK
jgi:hypothetical protein